MSAYRLSNVICAVALDREPQTVKQLQADSMLRMIEPSEELNGLVKVECDGERFAVFMRDLTLHSQLVRTARY